MTDRQVGPTGMRLQISPLLAIACAGCIFALDLVTPMGTAEWVLYLLPLILARSGSRRELVLLTALLVALMALGLFLSPPGVPVSVAVLNRIIGAGMLCVTAVLVVRRGDAERALSESEENFRLLFVNHPLPLWVCDPQTLGFVEVNEAAVRYYGYSRSEFLGMRASDLHVVEGEVRLYALFSRARTRIQDLGEVRHRRKDGQVGDVRMVCGPAKFAGQEAVLATVQDVTERKRAERERTRLEAALRRSEMMSSLGTLVVGVAHQLRNPLFGISATLDAFEARFGQDEATEEYFEVLRRELRRVNQLTRDLLEYGKPQSADLSPGAIEGVVTQAVDACGPLARDAKVQVVTKMGEDGPAVMMDPLRLQEVFENLIQNAIQQSPHGGTVVVEVEEAMCEQDRPWIRAAVRDSGNGFLAEDLPRIFEPFFTRRPGGTGLGLSIAQRIVEEHGGTVSACNDAAGGAQVEVRLPIVG